MNIKEQVLSREQMAHLQELGVDTSDASMCWVQFTNSEMGEYDLDIYDGTLYKTMKTPGNFVNDIVPTYTIGDLIDKLPKAIEGNCLVINYIYSEIIYKDILHYDFEGVGLLTTLYAVLCWVAEEHKELIK